MLRARLGINGGTLVLLCAFPLALWAEPSCAWTPNSGSTACGPGPKQKAMHHEKPHAAEDSEASASPVSCLCRNEKTIIKSNGVQGPLSLGCGCQPHWSLNPFLHAWMRCFVQVPLRSCCGTCLPSRLPHRATDRRSYGGQEGSWGLDQATPQAPHHHHFPGPYFSRRCVNLPPCWHPTIALACALPFAICYTKLRLTFWMR
jgi:hypothetical protein